MLMPLLHPVQRTEKSLVTATRRRVLRTAAPLLLVWGALITGCGPVDQTPEAPELSEKIEEQQSDNGLSLNGLSTQAFGAWFQSEPELASSVMRYVVLCAVPEGQSRTYTDGVTGKTYTWSGKLGVAPDWSSGRPATVVEQQLVSACMAAHVNKYGLHVPLSVLGVTAKGQPIAYTFSELSTYSHKEACFFGNLFAGEGIYVGKDRSNLSARESTARTCSIASTDEDGTRISHCAPLQYAGPCTNYCTLDATKTFYTSCRYNGVTYRPITTRLREEDIYSCGDGICQLTESCGTSKQYYNCKLDCGTCP